MRGEGKFDGVFGLWYGKGPGVDRSGDVFRHANLAGTSPHGGVLALMGDDHTAESSTTAAPVRIRLRRRDDADAVARGRAGNPRLRRSTAGRCRRFAGVWVGMKCIKDTIESTAVVDAVARARRARRCPTDFALPPGGLNIRTARRDPRTGSAAAEHKRDAVVAWLARQPDRPDGSIGRPKRADRDHHRRQILSRRAPGARRSRRRRGRLQRARRADLQARLRLAARARRRRANSRAGSITIIVVEEKRSLIEAQVREELYGAAASARLRRQDGRARRMAVPGQGALDPNDDRDRDRRSGCCNSPGCRAGARAIERLEARAARARRDQAGGGAHRPISARAARTTRSTVVPEGARAYAGIGCHFMAQCMDRRTDGYTQMGGEGANWVGEARFSKRGHVFQNLGDGTYNHSGALAIRAGRSMPGVNITYKILFNDAVAMTGGQRHEGGLTVPQIAGQVSAEGAKRVVVVTDEPYKYPAGTDWPAGVDSAPARRPDRGREGAQRDRRAPRC